MNADRPIPISENAQLAPMLSVRRGKDALQFYVAAFGAQELFKMEAPDGAVVAELAIGQSRFWVADESPEHKNFSPETIGGGSVRLLLIVDDPDAMVKRAIAAGARSVYSVGEGHGWRLGRVEDPFGHHWEIGKPLVAWPPARGTH